MGAPSFIAPWWLRNLLLIDHFLVRYFAGINFGTTVRVAAPNIANPSATAFDSAAGTTTKR